MEKQRSNTREKFCHRLLIAFSALFTTFFSHAYSQSFTDLHFKAQGEFAVSQESQFVLEVVDINPSDITIQNIILADNIQFLSMTKNDAFIAQDAGGSKKGTVITYTVRFLTDGVFHLEALTATINSQDFTIPFMPVTVHPNPGILVPQVFFESEHDLFQLEEGTLVLYGRHFKSVDGIDVSLSEDALIEKTQSIIEIPSADFQFSNERVVLATYSYIPFLSGTLALPQVDVSFVGYNNELYTISLSNEQVEVFPSNSKEQRQYGQERIQAQFEQEMPDTVIENLAVDRNEALVYSLLNLRIKEKYSLFAFSDAELRREIEQQQLLHNSDEISFVWTVVLFGLSISVGVLGFVFYKFKKAKQEKSAVSVVLFGVGILLLLTAIFFTVPLAKQNALAFGSYMYTIPEHESQVRSPIFAGTKVRILRNVGEWYLVLQHDGKTGWLLKSDCVLIEK